ncbi:hypothetical protein [Chromobacterium haemolyticum]|uniref:hypothetical protein n=1 Tax=Chromobacterium haemolyticum TaxID=394935 RepID=UPI00137526F9|nr:hypothetical protein [Chromobacterium haemolyticum]
MAILTTMHAGLADAIKRHLAFQVGKPFMDRILDDAIAQLSMIKASGGGHYKNPRLRTKGFGVSIPIIIADVCESTALECGMDARLVDSKPAGYVFTEIETDSFVIGARHDQSRWWSMAKHRLERSERNAALFPMTPDMFTSYKEIDADEKLYVQISIAVDQRELNLSQAMFEIPFPSLRGMFLRVPLEELRTLLHNDEPTVIEPMPKLKRQLAVLDGGE